MHLWSDPICLPLQPRTLTHSARRRSQKARTQNRCPGGPVEACRRAGKTPPGRLADFPYLGYFTRQIHGPATAAIRLDAIPVPYGASWLSPSPAIAAAAAATPAAGCHVGHLFCPPTWEALLDFGRNGDPSTTSAWTIADAFVYGHLCPNSEVLMFQRLQESG